MSYDLNVYCSPEKFGLTAIGEIDFSDGSYCFDYTVVWRDAEGQLLYADDSGCSCPSPFESVEREELTACTFAELQAYLEQRTADSDDERERCAGEVVDLLARVRDLPAVAAQAGTGGAA